MNALMMTLMVKMAVLLGSGALWAQQPAGNPFLTLVNNIAAQERAMVVPLAGVTVVAAALIGMISKVNPDWAPGVKGAIVGILGFVIVAIWAPQLVSWVASIAGA